MKKRMDTLKIVNFRMPRDWDSRAQIMAQARRTTKTAIIFEAVEKEWQRFTEERTRKHG
jgi:hypothetical protein